MNRIKIYANALIFLIVAMILSVGLILITTNLSDAKYVDPIGQLSCFGPLLASLFFIFINKKDTIKNISIKAFSFKPLLKLILIFSIAIIIGKSIELFIGLSEINIRQFRLSFINIEINPIYSYPLLFVLCVVYSGVGEEFGWRGYLFHKLRGLSWLELILVLNIIWALWHLPLFIYGIMGSQNLLIEFPLFLIFAMEAGVLLLYVRIKTKSVISAMIFHGFLNFLYGGVINSSLIKSNLESAGWIYFPLILALLPLTIFYYWKGKKLYEDDLKNNTVANKS